MNILEPLGNAVYSYLRWNYDVWFTKDTCNNSWYEDTYYNLDNFFREVGLKNSKGEYPVVAYPNKSKKGYSYHINCPIGLSLSDFMKYKEKIEIQVHENIEIRQSEGNIIVEVITKKLPENIPYSLPTRTKDSIYIPLGESLQGPIAIDLKENPHSYIVGTTGSGKSVCTKGILTSLVNNYRPNEVELYLCDLKMVELSLFRNLAHTKKFVYTVEDTTEVVADLLEETKNRYNTFMEKGVTSIFEYNKIPNVKKMKYQILFIEEAVILLEDSKKKAMKLLKQLIAISRASGCYVFLTTQRPSSDIIDNVVKANINNRIVFAVEDEKNSIICLDSSEAKDLRGKGNGILKVGPNKVEFQSYFISDKQVKEYTKRYIVKNKPEEPKTENKTINDKLVNDNIRELKKANKEELTDLSFLDNL